MKCLCNGICVVCEGGGDSGDCCSSARMYTKWGEKNCSWLAAVCFHVNDMRWGDGNEGISFILLPRQLLCFLQSTFS